MIPRRAWGWILAVCTVALVVANGESAGIARDEAVYMDAGVRYAEFWLHLPSKLSEDGITKTFGGKGPTDNNREHPPAMKTLFGLSHAVLAGLGADEVTALRFPSAVMHGVLVLLVFLMVLELWGFAEAIVSALLVMFLPRALFHASLATFDAPIMTLWFATVFAYWRALDGRKWPWQVGVVFGLALATKHTAVLLPFALGLHYIIAGIRERGLPGIVVFRWRVIVSLVVLGPAVLVAVWPWLWLDPIGHVVAWLRFHLEHVHYNFEYLGHNWNAPRFPWHIALVTTAFTVPAVTLGGGVIGAVRWLGRRPVPRDPRMPGLLLLLSAAASIGPFFLGTTPIFGAEKHWMPALPTLCIAAGIGTVWAARALAAFVLPGSARGRAVVVTVVIGAVVAAAVVETATAQPYALTWYNAIAGGAPGGADRGMNRQFWGVAARGVLPVLDADAPGTVVPATAREPGIALVPGGPKLAAPVEPVYTHDATPAWGWYMKRRELWPWLPDSGHEVAGIQKSQYALVIHEKHFNRHDYLIWKAYGTVQPMFVLRADGVPIVSLYKRPAPKP